jgi:predicted dinucleotide-binding enzyme
MDETIITYAAQLDSKIIIDAANKLGSGGSANSLGTFQDRTPHAHAYRAFNTLGWENFADPLFNGVQADLFYCGPDGKIREVVEQLIADVGLRPMWLGDVDQVDLVDSIAGLWFALALRQGKGRHLAFKVLTR